MKGNELFKHVQSTFCASVTQMKGKIIFAAFDTALKICHAAVGVNIRVLFFSASNTFTPDKAVLNVAHFTTDRAFLFTLSLYRLPLMLDCFRRSAYVATP
jgi:hypothetical protein